MNVAVTIPDKFVENQREISREMLESYAVESYRQERLSLGQVSELLGFSIDETHTFLKERRVPSSCNRDDFDRDRRAVEVLLRKC